MATKNIKAGNAYVEIGIRNRISAGAKGVQADLNRLSNSLKSHGQSIMRLGGAISAAMAAPLALAIRAGSQMQETMGKFTTVFGDAAKSMQAWGETTATAMGVSEQSMMSMLSSMQDLLVPMGVMDEKARDMSKELTALAIDLASFNNMSPEKTFEDLMAAMTGSGEVMKKYGVILSQTAVNQELMQNSIDPKAATEAQKAQARLTIIMRGTTAAQGDALRTSASFANRLKALKAILTDVAVSLGAPLLDPLAHFLGYLNNGVGFLKTFVKENQELVRVLGMGMIAIGGVGVSLVGLGGVLTAAGIAFGVLAKGIGLILSPVGLALAGVAALGYAIVQYTDIGGRAIDAFKERFGPLAEAVKASMDAIGKALAAGDIQGAWNILAASMELVWLDLTDELKSAWVSFVDFVLDTTSNIGRDIAHLVTGLADLLQSVVRRFENAYNEMYQNALDHFTSGSGVKTIGARVPLKKTDPGLQFATNNLGIHSPFDSMRRFGYEMGDEVRRRQQARQDQRAADAEKRQDRMAELRAIIEDGRNRVVPEKEKPKSDAGKKKDEEPKDIKANDEIEKANDELAKVLDKFLKDTDEKFDIESEKPGETKQEELGQRPGQTGTFSAFGASVIGATPPIQKVSDPAALKEQRIANRQLAQMNRFLKNMGGGVIGIFAEGN